MTHIKQQIGHRGEELATAYLIRTGHTIVARNVRYKCGEIDIITRKNSTIHYIEVKTRTSENFGTPVEAVNAKKRQRMQNALQCHQRTQGYYGRSEYQVDIIAIMLNHDHKLTHLTYYKNV